jgi:hypothetical protein
MFLIKLIKSCYRIRDWVTPVLVYRISWAYSISSCTIIHPDHNMLSVCVCVCVCVCVQIYYKNYWNYKNMWADVRF